VAVDNADLELRLRKIKKFEFIDQTGEQITPLTY